MKWTNCYFVNTRSIGKCTKCISRQLSTRGSTSFAGLTGYFLWYFTCFFKSTVCLGSREHSPTVRSRVIANKICGSQVIFTNTYYMTFTPWPFIKPLSNVLFYVVITYYILRALIISGSVVECTPGARFRFPADADIYERRLWREIPNGRPSQPRPPDCNKLLLLY